MDVFLKRLLTVCATIFLLWYVGYQLFQVLYTPVRIETVTAYSVYDTVETQSIAIRQETKVPDTSAGGYLYYEIENGNRIAKGGTIARLFHDENTADVRRQLELVESEITLLKNVEQQGSNSRTNLDAINKQLSMKTEQLAQTMHESSASNLREMRSNLLALMNKRQITVGKVTDFQGQITALTAERDRLSASASAPLGTVAAPAAGYFVNTVDGYEELLSPDQAVSLTVDQINEALNSHPVVPSGYIGKVASDYTWYLACVVPLERVGTLATGQKMNVLLPFVSGDMIEVTVAAVNKQTDGQAALVLECSEMSDTLSGIRIEPVQLLLKEYSGLRVPDDALQFNKNNEPGVYVRVGTVMRFKRVNILYHSENDGYSICEVKDNDGENEYLRLYDDIVIGGKEMYDGKVID